MSNPHAKGRWKPGESGNPKGRSRAQLRSIMHISALAREHTDKAMKVIIGMLDARKRGVPFAVRLRAAEIIIERGYGRTPAVVQLTGRPVESLTDAELIAIAAGSGEGIVAEEGSPGELPSVH